MAVDEEESIVIRMINSAAVLRSETLDLSRKGIVEIPKEILELKYLESLHLEGNYITELPEEFFEKLKSLKWLDVRSNRLTSLPISVGRHRSLRTLLMEGNSLTHLPCELGMAVSLCGLNLSGNPLEFPPPYIIKKGTQEILKYLREMCKKTGWTDEKCPESGSSDQESELDYFNSGVDGENGVANSAGSQISTLQSDYGRIKMSVLKLPPIVRNATIVRRTTADVPDERESVQGQTVKKFEPIRRSTWEAMPFLNESTGGRAQKRRSKRDGENTENDNKMEGLKEGEMMAEDEEEASPYDEKIANSLKKIKIKRKRSPRKAKKSIERVDRVSISTIPQKFTVSADEVTRRENDLQGDGIQARFGVLVGDMVAISVSEKHLIKGQPCVGKVVSEADERGLVMVHYYIGTYEGSFRPMMSRSSPYLRQVSLENILCKFEMKTGGRVSPRTVIRIRQIVERQPESAEKKNHRLKPLTLSSDFPEPANAPSTFHPPPKRIDHLRYEYDKLRISSGGSEPSIASTPRRRSSLDGEPKKARRPRKRSKGKVPLDSYTPSSASVLKETKASKEKRLRRTASLNQKEAIHQQRIKNKLALDDWRQESRDLRQEKQYEALRKGVTKVKIPSPFATEETQATDESKGTQKKVQEYNKRLHALLEMNDKDLTKKVLNDRELEHRIKVHMKKIREHRNTKFNKVSEEVEEAKNNLEVAHDLHEELAQRRVLEYRLRAFTGDDFVPNPAITRNKKGTF